MAFSKVAIDWNFQTMAGIESVMSQLIGLGFTEISRTGTFDGGDLLIKFKHKSTQIFVFKKTSGGWKIGTEELPDLDSYGTNILKGFLYHSDSGFLISSGGGNEEIRFAHVSGRLFSYSYEKPYTKLIYISGISVANKGSGVPEIILKDAKVMIFDMLKYDEASGTLEVSPIEGMKNIYGMGAITIGQRFMIGSKMYEKIKETIALEVV